MRLCFKLNFVVAANVINAGLTILLIGVAAPSKVLFVIWAVVTRLGLASFTFWKVSAQCWLVDEDMLFGKEPGRRREGIIFGALNMVQNLAAALFAAVVFIGLGLNGLTTKNCSMECDGLSECVDACFSDVIASQPESLRFFITFIIGYLSPICEFLLAFHAYKFPIKSARLRKLYNAMAESRDEEPWREVESPPTSVRGRIDQMASHQASSKMGVHMGKLEEFDQGQWATSLNHVVTFANNRPGPKSMAVFLEWNDGSGFFLSEKEQAILDSSIIKLKDVDMEPSAQPGMPALARTALKEAAAQATESETIIAVEEPVCDDDEDTVTV